MTRAALVLALCCLARSTSAQEPPPSAAGVEPPPPAAASADAELQRLQEQSRALEARVAELEAAQSVAQLQGLEASDGSSVTSQPFLVYGFADFGLNHAWIGKNSFLNGLTPAVTTFTLGNLNLYFDFQPDPAWQVLTEVRFTLYPHGVEETLATPLGGEYRRIDTSVVDVASPATAMRFRWGGVLIERAYVKYSFSEMLNVRVGMFLTPYGIWNVDHGTPTLIALMMPHFVSVEVFPARQIGVALNGAFLSSGWKLGYDAYVSNGRAEAQIDFTSNKAVGLRLSAARMAPVPVAFGASLYYGQLDDIVKTIVSFDPFDVRRDFIVEGTEFGVGVDASVDIDALRIRTEGIFKSTRFEDGKRPLLGFGPPGSTKPDNNEYDAYVLAAYRLPFLGLEPFLYGEYNHYVSPYGDDQAVLAVGLNIHFTSFAQLKTQIARVLFFDVDATGDTDFDANNTTLLFSRLAVAF